MKNNQNKAFTFIELLVAITIFSIIAVSIYSTLNAGIRVWLKGNSIIRDNQALRVFFDSISSDLRNLTAYSGIRGEWGQGSVTFPAAINVAYGNTMRAELAKVTYALDDSNGGLTRICVTGKEGFDSQYAEGQADFGVLRNLSFEYGYKSATTEGECEWRDNWGKADRIPRLVKIKVGLQGRAESNLFEKIVVIPMGELGEEE